MIDLSAEFIGEVSWPSLTTPRAMADGTGPAQRQHNRLVTNPTFQLTMAVSLDSILWYGSLAVLAVAVLPLDNWLPIAIHPIIRYALGATALVVILFFMGDDVVPVVTMETSPHVEGGVGDVDGKVDESKEARREHLKAEIRRKILNDAYRDVQRASAGAVPPSTSGAGDDNDDDTGREEIDAVGAKTAENQDGDSNGEGKNKKEDDENDDDLGTNNSNTWRCACENGFLPPGLLKTFGGAEAVMRMGMGQCYHKGGV